MKTVDFIRALIVLHREFHAYPWHSRAHILIRFLTCPFVRIAKHVPRGTLLDIGAGHGVFAVLARERGANVTTVDPDVRKVRRLREIKSVAGYDDCIRGTFDAVSLIDVMYKIPMSEWDALLDRIRTKLKPGGTLIIKEHDPTSLLKQQFNRFQESLATAGGLTLGSAFSYETPDAFMRRLEKHGFAVAIARRIDFGYPHPHMLYVARI